MVNQCTEHLMVRAEEEAVLAIQAKDPAAARIHQALALRYSTKVVSNLRAQEEHQHPDEACISPSVDA